MTPLSPSVQALLELFRGPLADVRFADIDAAGLGNLALEAEAAASAVEREEAKLAELRQVLAQRQEELLTMAQRALAYARVYAENDEALSNELNLISLPRAGKQRKGSSAKTSGAAEVQPTQAEDTSADESQLTTGAVVDAHAEQGGSVEESEMVAPARKGKRRDKTASLSAQR